jgi:hypothetical protein
MDLNTDIGIGAGVVTVLGSVWQLYRHISFKQTLKKDRERGAILAEAKAELSRVENDLNEKIKVLEIELAVQKDNVSKDLSHLKEVYNAEIKVLGEKIDLLRQDLQSQHSSMVALLTKLVSSR